MTNHKSDRSIRHAALVSGVSIIIMAVAAIIATDVALNRLIEPGDAAVTTSNLRSSEVLFRFGVFSWLVILVCDVLAAWGLYIFLKPVSQSVSLLAAWFRLVYAAVLGAAIFNLILILQLLHAETYAAAAGQVQLDIQVLLSVNAFYDTWSLGLAVFGFHILFLGYLILKSGYVPKVLGVLLIFAFLGYLITNSANLLLPDYENYKTIVELIFIIPMLGEVALGIWLLWKGTKVQPD